MRLTDFSLLTIAESCQERKAKKYNRDLDEKKLIVLYLIYLFIYCSKIL